MVHTDEELAAVDSDLTRLAQAIDCGNRKMAAVAARAVMGAVEYHDWWDKEPKDRPLLAIEQFPGDQPSDPEERERLKAAVRAIVRYRHDPSYSAELQARCRAYLALRGVPEKATLEAELENAIAHFRVAANQRERLSGVQKRALVLAYWQDLGGKGFGPAKLVAKWNAAGFKGNLRSDKLETVKSSIARIREKVAIAPPKKRKTKRQNKRAKK